MKRFPSESSWHPDFVALDFISEYRLSALWRGDSRAQSKPLTAGREACLELAPRGFLQALRALPPSREHEQCPLCGPLNHQLCRVTLTFAKLSQGRIMRHIFDSLLFKKKVITFKDSSDDYYHQARNHRWRSVCTEHLPLTQFLSWEMPQVQDSWLW